MKYAFFPGCLIPARHPAMEFAIRSSLPKLGIEIVDLEGAIREAAGGTISVEPFGFPGGRRFHFKDPSGNELAVWTER